MIRILTLCGACFLASLAQALSVGIQDQRAETCGNANGSIRVLAVGGQEPYSYDWTGPNGFVGSGSEITGLVGGDYTVVVTDALAATTDLTIPIGSLSELPYGSGPTWAGAADLTGYWGGACEGQCNGAGAFVDGYNGGTPPFSYSFDVPANYLGYNATVNGPVYGGFCHAESVNYTYSDALGCMGYGSFVVYGVDGSWTPTVLETQGACTGMENGSVSLEAFSGFWSTSTFWSDGLAVASQTDWIGSTTVTDLAAGTYTVITDFLGTQCSLQQELIIPDLGPACGTLNGTSWYDLDGDCIRDTEEVGIPNSILSVEPGGHLIHTHWDGSFQLALPSGSYTLAQNDPTLVPICPVPPVQFTIGTSPVTLDLANGSTQPLDLGLWAAGSAARPGFAHDIYCSVRNLSPQASGPVTFTVTLDPALDFVVADPPPTAVSANVLTYSWPEFGSYEDRFVHVELVVPVGTALGTILSSTCSASNTLIESDPTNNTTVLETTVTGSFDPNDKTARTSSRASEDLYFINGDTYIDYTIRFQNTGTDTAFTVVITDTLSADFDMGSFQHAVCSHPCVVDFKAGRVVEWTFADILLPDSTVDEAGSHGLASFRIELNEPVLPGTLIENTANIFFDFNEPVITEPSVLLAESSTVITSSQVDPIWLAPNPTTSTVTVGATSSIRSIDVFSADGRPVLSTRVNGPMTVVDLQALPPASFILRIHLADGRTYHRRSIKR